MFGLQLGRLGIAGSLFNESALWPQGASSPGLWIDPSYVASCFQDSSGTTALSTVGTVLDTSNPVGLVLDRKGGLVLGPNIIAGNSATFDSGVGSWNGGLVATVAAVGGELVITQTGANGRGVLIFPCKAGVTYEVSADIRSVNGVGCALGVSVWSDGNTASWSSSTASSAYVRKTLRLPSLNSTNTQYNITVGADGAGTGIFACDNISVREIPGIHATQATAPARALLSGRKNLLLGTDALATQSVTVAAIPHTITFSGGGTVTASGTFVGALTSGQTFTPTAGTLTLTVAGSVTSAMLNRGPTALTYQAVVSASDYDASAGPTYLKFDGTDDALASATFAAGTLTSSMDCLIAVRRDSAANVVAGLYNAVADATKYFGMAESASGSAAVGTGAGTPTIWVDGTQLAGGTAVTRGTLHTALTVGSWHILELRGLDLSTWTATGIGNYTGYVLNGTNGAIQLFASGQDANREKAKRRMAAYFGVTLA